jgi:hypothetical protein
MAKPLGKRILANKGPPQQEFTTLPVEGQFHKIHLYFLANFLCYRQLA